MSERMPSAVESQEQSHERLIREYRALAEGLIAKHERFPFQGVDPEAYGQLKADSEEFPEFTTHIDVQIRKFHAEGFKLVLGYDDGKQGNVTVFPADTGEAKSDELYPRHLMICEGMDEDLKRLILADKALRQRK